MKALLTTSIFVASISILVGCSKSDADPLYSNCVSIGMEEQMKGWDESDRPSIKVGVEQGCKIVVRECKDNSKGELCTAFRNKFNAEL